MFFHIIGSHSYDTCHVHDSEKVNTQKAAFDSAAKHGIKFHYNYVNRLTHTTYLLAEADTYEAVEAMFDPILELGHYEIVPVVNRSQYGYTYRGSS